MRVVALDPGEKRVGLAVSDDDGRIALALPLYRNRSDGGDAERIAALVREQEAKEVVVGLPLNMDGSEGPAAEKARAFAGELKLHLDIPIRFCDERLTSAEAAERLCGVPMSRAKKRDHTNTVAAQVILESYLRMDTPSEDPC